MTLLIDRLKVEVDWNPALAQEIGHGLQGLMKERWTRREIADTRKPRLRFTAYDAELIPDLPK